MNVYVDIMGIIEVLQEFVFWTLSSEWLAFTASHQACASNYHRLLLSAGIGTHSVIDIRAFSVIHLGVVLYVYWPHVDF